MIPRWRLVFFALALIFVLAGCQTAPRKQSAGDKRTELEQAMAAVDQARRTGASTREPFECAAAERYLDLARQAKGRNKQSYSIMALQHAAAALGDAPVEAAPPATCASQAECQAAFEQAQQRYSGILPEKAVVVAPVAYADITAWMSQAKQELGKRGSWRIAAQSITNATQAMDSLDKQDADTDSIVDLADGAPFTPEDTDGFQDEDGAPDLDNDGDNIPDMLDRAPNEPETVNRWMDDDGAPDAYPELSPVYFAEGSATLTADQRGYLRGAALLLSAAPALRLNVAGHTDNTHSETYNMDLARRCAEAVQRALIEQGVGAERIRVTLVGAAQPVGDNTASAGRALNRRVELHLE